MLYVYVRDREGRFATIGERSFPITETQLMEVRHRFRQAHEEDVRKMPMTYARVLLSEMLPHLTPIDRLYLGFAVMADEVRVSWD